MSHKVEIGEAHPFEVVAIELGYVTIEQIEQALAYQEQKGVKGEARKLLGIALVELEILTFDQVKEILKAQESGMPLAKRTKSWTDRLHSWFMSE